MKIPEIVVKLKDYKSCNACPFITIIDQGTGYNCDQGFYEERAFGNEDDAKMERPKECIKAYGK